MSALGVFQTLIDLAFGVGIFFVIMRITRQPKDDPRLSRGLQLLQAKIAVLEDLSDKSEQQVNQMVALLEQKTRDVQNKIQIADKHVQYIRESMEKSLEVAKIFQDKIPHQEIIERQNTKKYLKAARMANAGKSVQEIAAEVELPLGELEFIAKVNRNQLMFSEDQLPEWAREEAPAAAGTPAPVVQAQFQAQQEELIQNLEQVKSELDEALASDVVIGDYGSAFDVPQIPASLNRLGEEFRKAVNDSNVQYNQTSTLSFVELTPPPADEAETTQEVQARLFGAQEPLLDFDMSEFANEQQAEPPQIARALTNQAASIQKTGSAVAQANAQARAQMLPETATAAPLQQQQQQTQAQAQQAGARAAQGAQAAAVAQANAIAQQKLQQSKQAQALAQARAQAQELRKPQPKSSVNTRDVEIKRVQFPRIKSTDNLG